VVITAC